MHKQTAEISGLIEVPQIMLRMAANLIKGKVKAKLGLTLNGGERFILAALFSNVDRVPLTLVAGNVSPR